MAMQSKITKFIIWLVLNIILLFILYHITIDNNSFLDNLCLYKRIFGVECWNCGMTRAFLYILHFNFQSAIDLNNKVIFVFPAVVIVYLYSSYKYIMKEEGVLK